MKIKTPKLTVTHKLPTKSSKKSGNRGQDSINLLKPQKHRRKKVVKLSLFLVLPILFGALIFARWWKIPEAVPQAETSPEIQLLAETTETEWAMPLDLSEQNLQIITDLVPVLLTEFRKVPTAEELKNTKRKERLKKFLESYNSPFAESDDTIQAFLDSKNMRLMIAISFVESTMGKRCYYNNCSGIGGYPPDLRKYDSFADWIRDFDSLLERRYKGLPIEKFMGLYVQPGSPNWINGVRQVLADLQASKVE